MESGSESVSENDFEMIHSSASRLSASDRKRQAKNQDNIGRSIATMKNMTKKRTDLWCLALQLTLKKLPPNARKDMKIAITSLVDQRYPIERKPKNFVDVKVKMEPLTPDTENGDATEAENATPTTVAKPTLEERSVQTAPDNMAAMVWRGSLSMIDVTTFNISISSIYGDATHLVFPFELDVVGRIIPESVYEYIRKVSITNEIVLLRFSPGTSGDESAYKAFVHYLYSRHRFGVIHTRCRLIKDFYVLPLPAGRSLTSTLIPADGNVDLGVVCTDLLLGIVIKSKTQSTSSTSHGRGSGR